VLSLIAVMKHNYMFTSCYTVITHALRLLLWLPVMMFNLDYCSWYYSWFIYKSDANSLKKYYFLWSYVSASPAMPLATGEFSIRSNCIHLQLWILSGSLGVSCHLITPLFIRVEFCGFHSAAGIQCPVRLLSTVHKCFDFPVIMLCVQTVIIQSCATTTCLLHWLFCFCFDTF